MNVWILGNEVDLCKSCEKDWESCDAYDDAYIRGAESENICCCARYVPVMTREEKEKTGHWVHVNGKLVKCSECGAVSLGGKYCRECAVKMDEGDDE